MNQDKMPRWFVSVKLAAWFLGATFVTAVSILDRELFPSEGEYKVRGPLFALVAAAALLFRAVPTEQEDHAKVVNDLLVLLSAASGLLAGWCGCWTTQTGTRGRI